MKVFFTLILILLFIHPIVRAGQYSGSTTFQASGNLVADSNNQVILYLKLDASITPPGTWGVSGVRFHMLNSSNSMVRAAKIYSSTSSTFSNINLLDSISNPGDTLQFQFNLQNLGSLSRYLYLCYDIDSNTSCNTFTFDARVDSASLQITGLGAGNYSPVNPDPNGTCLLPNPTVVPSISISCDTLITCLSDTVSFTAVGLNGGSNASFKWYKNGALKETNTTGHFSLTGLTSGDEIFCKLLSSLPCITATPVSSNIYYVTLLPVNHVVSIATNGMLTQGNMVQFTALSNCGFNSSNYQWYKNNIPIGALDNTFLDSTLQAGDQVTCSFESNLTCVTPNIAISNMINVSFPNSVRNRDVALLDLGPENQETNGSNLYSASHMLDVAGISYTVVTDIFEAQNYAMVVGSSTVGYNVFVNAERIALRNYVRNGGILFTIRLKDPDLYPLFGISSFDTQTTRHTMNWNMASNDADLQWFDDPLEQTMSLGDTSTPSVIETLGYTLSTGVTLGSYDDGKVCVSKNAYGSGFAYNFGISLKEIIFRNQVNKDYDAEREYTNAFEPTTDDLFLLMRAIYSQHINYGVWKHTSPNNSKSTLIVTHDIDALSSVNLMESFANYEDSMKIGSTYFMTVHYNNDFISAFYDSSIANLNNLLLKNRTIASHSVGHFPDMDDSIIVVNGASGNTRANYHPMHNSGPTVGANIWGELEVSKNLLETDCITTIRSFRPGYLLVHPKQMQVMDSLGYEYSSSYTAADVLTNFPYNIHENKSFQSRLTNMLEIPVGTSDVIRDYVLDSTNFPTLVTKWKNVYLRNHANNAPTVLLIHPTRSFKLSAQRSLINQLPNDVVAISMESFGSYWKYRNSVHFTSTLSGTSLSVIISNSSLPLDSSISFIIDKGQNLSLISVRDENNQAIAFIVENWGINSKIIYLKPENLIGIRELFNKDKSDATNFSLLLVPNLLVDKSEITFTLQTSAMVELSILNSLGEQISTLLHEPLLGGVYKKTIERSSFLPGLYFCKLNVNGKTAICKFVVLK